MEALHALLDLPGGRHRAGDRRHDVDEALTRLHPRTAIGAAVRLLCAVVRVDDRGGEAHRHERLVCDLVGRRHRDHRADRRVRVPREPHHRAGGQHRADHRRRDRPARGGGVVSASTARTSIPAARTRDRAARRDQRCLR